MLTIRTSVSLQSVASPRAGLDPPCIRDALPSSQPRLPVRAARLAHRCPIPPAVARARIGSSGCRRRVRRREMARILLVHGAFAGAWCWEPALPGLRAGGHTVETIDLPGAGEDPTPVAEVTLDAYGKRICEVLAEGPPGDAGRAEHGRHGGHPGGGALPRARRGAGLRRRLSARRRPEPRRARLAIPRPPAIRCRPTSSSRAILPPVA